MGIVAFPIRCQISGNGMGGISPFATHIPAYCSHSRRRRWRTGRSRRESPLRGRGCPAACCSTAGSRQTSSHRPCGARDNSASASRTQRRRGETERERASERERGAHFTVSPGSSPRANTSTSSLTICAPPDQPWNATRPGLSAPSAPLAISAPTEHTSNPSERRLNTRAIRQRDD
jgi:hypothetical protein